MTPAARHAAAIDILDRWLSGTPAEVALTQWARNSRFAGSGDREAVRDLVFRAVRQRRSLAAYGAYTGRGLLLGMAKMDAQLLEEWTGEGHAPASLSDEEKERLISAQPELTRGEELDCPDWLLPHFDAALGAQADQILSLMRDRAPVFIRANTAKTTVANLARELAKTGIEAKPHPLAKTALEITANPRRLRTTEAFEQGLFEMQDVASQAISLTFASHAGQGTRVLDYCAGGGGKSLALAAAGLAPTAYDIDAGRMRDIPVRAKRAGVRVPLLTDAPTGQWPSVFADAPCSGSGSWRRSPEAKWAFTEDRLCELTSIQSAILEETSARVSPGGVLGYATCSVFKQENRDRVEEFLAAHPDWQLLAEQQLTPLDGGDGFYLAILKNS